MAGGGLQIPQVQLAAHYKQAGLVTVSALRLSASAHWVETAGGAWLEVVPWSPVASGDEVRLCGEAARKPDNSAKVDGGSRTASRTPALLSQYQLGDRRELHVGCALVDLADLGVAPVLLDRVILGKSIPAIDFNGQ